MRGYIITTPAEYVAMLDTFSDQDTPRADRPVRFVPRVVAPFGLRWGLVNRFALVSPSRIA